MTSETGLTIARLASTVGVSVETVRYYQRRGLIRQPPRPFAGARRYSSDDADCLRFIKRAQTMGFTLAETVKLLKLRRDGSCSETRNLAVSKLHAIDERLRELHSLRMELAELVARCETTAGDRACPVIERLTRLTRKPR